MEYFLDKIFPTLIGVVIGFVLRSIPFKVIFKWAYKKIKPKRHGDYFREREKKKLEE